MRKRLLSTLFDKPQSSSFLKWSKPVGLFNYSDLKVPNDFIIAADKTIEKAMRLIDVVIQQPQANGWSVEDHMKLTVKRLDRLSNMLCVVVDTAELIRYSIIQEIVYNK